MRPLRAWFVALLASGVCLGLSVVTLLPGQEEAGKRLAKPSAESPAGGVGAAMGMDAGMEEMPGGMPGSMMGSSAGSMPMGYGLDPHGQQAFEAQQQVDQALATYGATEDETEREAIKVGLTKALERQFEIQQQRRMNELAEIENRVQKLRELIEKRNQAKQTIVAKRCDQLLSEIDGLGWTSPDGGPQSPYGGYTMPGMGMPAGGPGWMSGSGAGMMPYAPGMGSGPMIGVPDAGSSGSAGPSKPAPPAKTAPGKEPRR